jgi:hypothetical protein
MFVSRLENFRDMRNECRIGIELVHAPTVSECETFGRQTSDRVDSKGLHFASGYKAGCRADRNPDTWATFVLIIRGSGSPVLCSSEAMSIAFLWKRVVA